MTNGGDAAEQVVRLSLEGFEVAARLTGSAAKNVAILLASVLKQEATQANKTRGKARLTNMIKSGKELKVFSIPNKDLKKFTEQAKRYGVLYCVLRDKNTKGDNVPIDIIARAEDASKIQRIVERFELGKVDKAAIVTESQKAVEKREALEKEKPAINYGYIEGVMAPDGEEQDAYILGVNEPVKKFTGKIIAIVRRKDDMEEKWIVVPDGVTFSKEEIRRQIHFLEQYFDSEIVM